MKMLLWDCKACDHAGMPASSHNHCSSCGASRPKGSEYELDVTASRKILGDGFFESQIICSSCSTHLPETYSFCNHCGVNLQPKPEVDVNGSLGDANPISFDLGFQVSKPKAEGAEQQNARKKQPIPHKVKNEHNTYVIRRKAPMAQRLSVLVSVLLVVLMITSLYFKHNPKDFAMAKGQFASLLPSNEFKALYSKPSHSIKRGWCRDIPKSAVIKRKKIKKRLICQSKQVSKKQSCKSNEKQFRKEKFCYYVLN